MAAPSPLDRLLGGDCTWHVEQGDTMEVLDRVPFGSVHMVVTSPPYWMPLEYVSLPPTLWTSEREKKTGYRPVCGTEDARPKHRWSKPVGSGWRECFECGVWEGCLGTEPTLEMWAEHIVEVFRKVRNVLREDGTLWLNIGDAYVQKDMASNGLKPKDLTGCAWEAARALRKDGWYLRSDTIYAKTSAMPEAATDRPTKAHEYMFLLTKSPRYFYDDHALREFKPEGSVDPYGRATTVWRLSPHWSVDESAHFAAFPPALVEPAVVAGSSEKGVCSVCGEPWVRLTESSYEDAVERGAGAGRRAEGAVATGARPTMRLAAGKRVTVHRGWVRDCVHADDQTVPALVMDPFSGTGTTGVVSRRHKRRYMGIELAPDYHEFSLRRIEEDQPMFNAPCDEEVEA